MAHQANGVFRKENPHFLYKNTQKNFRFVYFMILPPSFQLGILKEIQILHRVLFVRRCAFQNTNNRRLSPFFAFRTSSVTAIFKRQQRNLSAIRIDSCFPYANCS